MLSERRGLGINMVHYNEVCDMICSLTNRVYRYVDRCWYLVYDFCTQKSWTQGGKYPTWFGRRLIARLKFRVDLILENREILST